jgi:hypothetical protein
MVNIGKGNKRYTYANRNYYKRHRAMQDLKKLKGRGLNPRLAVVDTG